MYLNLQAPRYSRVCENQVPLYREYLALYKDYLVRYDAFRVSNQIVSHNSNQLGICSGKHNEDNSNNRGGRSELEDSGVGFAGSECSSGIGGTSVPVSLRATSEAGCDTQAKPGFVAASLRGPNYERNQVNREKKKLNKNKRLDSNELVKLRIDREREQLAISKVFRERQEEQARISRLFRERQERLDDTAVSIAVQAEIDNGRKLLEKLRIEQQLKLWDHSSEGLERRKKEAIARSELNIAKYENMKERKLKLQEIERKENWREEATVVSPKPSVPSSVSARSSAGQGVASSTSSVVSGKPKLSAGVEKKLHAIHRKIALLAILDAGGDFDCNADEDEARLHDMNRDASQRAAARKLAEQKRTVKKGWF